MFKVKQTFNSFILRSIEIVETYDVVWYRPYAIHGALFMLITIISLAYLKKWQNNLNYFFFYVNKR